MMNGIIVLGEDNRLDIQFESGDCYGGLHCGKAMEALVDGVWIPTRVEMADDWYLVGLSEQPILGLTVRI